MAAEEVARAATGPLVLVTKSTVPVGTGREVRAIVRKARPELAISVASNPEFLREGSAIGDFMRPDRVVIGTEDEQGLAVLKRLYRPLYLIETPVLATSLETAELIKYAANAFLATKITFINEIADLCEKVGADVHDVARGMGLDGRIGRKFLHPGPGYGGSCFPKDTLALVKTGQDHDAPIRIVETVVQVNDLRKRAMGRKIVKALGGDARGKKVALLGLTFKPNTDDIREAPALEMIDALLQRGAKVQCYDPEAMPNVQRSLGDTVVFAEKMYDALEGADFLVVATEWPEFRTPDFAKIDGSLKEKVIFDGRNVFEMDTMRKHGYSYYSIGRKAIK